MNNKGVYDENSLINMTLTEYRKEISNFDNIVVILERHIKDKHLPENIKEYARKLLSEL